MKLVVDNEKLRIQRLVLGAWSTNAYIIVCKKTGSSAVVDVPSEAGTIVKHLQGTSLRYVLLTHNHLDHIDGLKDLREWSAVPLAIHIPDNKVGLPFPPEIIIKSDSNFKLGELKVKALHTPGHTPGSTCYLVDTHLLAGDTIFPGGPGKTSTPDDFRRIVRSITAKIFTLPDETIIYPGHGEPTILKKEKDEFVTFMRHSHSDELCGDVLWLTS